MSDMDRSPAYQENSLPLAGAVALGNGVMIGAGIFALTGQMAEMTGELFPLAFLSAALIVFGVVGILAFKDFTTFAKTFSAPIDWRQFHEPLARSTRRMNDA